MENNSLEFVSGDENKLNSTINDSNDGHTDISTWYEDLCGESNSKNNPILYLNNNMSDRKWSQSCLINDNESHENNSNAEMRNIENQIETSKQVLKLEAESGCTITQVNGQRKLGPPPGWIGPPPDPSCEIFVGKIPRNLYEHELYPIFRSIGEIYEIRLMMDFSGTNRGYCFVMYTKASDANRAIKELDNYEIRPGRKIGVLPSINNCRLCVSQLPHNLDTETFIRKICDTTTEVRNVAIYRYPDGRVKNALISYKTHIAAAMGRRRLVPDRTNLFPGVDLTIDWAHPKLTPYNMYYHNVVE
ncbi:hypothetical protein PV327_008594 [Microctonus hyperodae]|uniref:RRM domain-containing protein n=1 Tax=Microctonus hyperodae TaxID=165561 RepID=A0AA39F3H0_MICHY|nr:hypothetical protein PV327_008594 [Microctonus hyperodae]